MTRTLVFGITNSLGGGNVKRQQHSRAATDCLVLRREPSHYEGAYATCTDRWIEESPIYEANADCEPGDTVQAVFPDQKPINRTFINA